MINCKLTLEQLNPIGSMPQLARLVLGNSWLSLDQNLISLKPKEPTEDEDEPEPSTKHLGWLSDMEALTYLSIGTQEQKTQTIIQ